MVVLICLECRAFQAFLLSNYFITKALVNVKLFYERTSVVLSAIITDKVTNKIDNFVAAISETV